MSGVPDAATPAEVTGREQLRRSWLSKSEQEGRLPNRYGICPGTGSLALLFSFLLLAFNTCVQTEEGTTLGFPQPNAQAFRISVLVVHTSLYATHLRHCA